MKKEQTYTHTHHTISNRFDENSKVLILGHFRRSNRENQFYYGHPQNRFWKVIAGLTESECHRPLKKRKIIAGARHRDVGCH